jgi:hypothetical protein
MLVVSSNLDMALSGKNYYLAKNLVCIMFFSGQDLCLARTFVWSGLFSGHGSCQDNTLTWKGVFSGQLVLNIYCTVRVFAFDNALDWIRLLWTGLLSGQRAFVRKGLLFGQDSSFYKIFAWTGL